MLILLPPSEGKTAAATGPPLDPAELSFPALAAARRRVRTAVQRACRRADAATVLGLPAGQAELALQRNLRLADAPTLPAGQIYSGVLYDNLALGSLDPQWAAERLLIFSGLWGVLTPADRIPPYRLAMGVALPPLGRLSTYWRPTLTTALAAAAEPHPLVVDMRSAPYAAAWRPPGTTVAVRVLREQIVDGRPRRTVVSHMAKATRGRVAHDLLAGRHDPRSPEELLKVMTDLGHTAELDGARLNVIVSE